MTRRKKDIADRITDQILGPAPPKRSRGRPPGKVVRPPTEAELERNRAAAGAAGAKRVNPAGRARTVDQAYVKMRALAAGAVRARKEPFAERFGEEAGEQLEDIAKEIDGLGFPVTRD